MNQDEAVATLIKYRMEQAKKSIEDACCLEAGTGSPRSIINRAYYATFYAVLALLLREGKSYAKHSGVIGAFDRSFVRNGLLPKTLSADLHKLFELRQEYDYKIVSEPDTGDAHDAIVTAKHFVEVIEHFLCENNAIRK